MRVERSRSRRSRALAPLVAGLLAGCATTSPFLWVENMPKRSVPEDKEYRAAAGDLLNVRVWNQDSMSTEKTRVREDGKISIPFLQNVDVEGMTLDEISTRLAVKLKPYIVSPLVTVSVEERRPLRVSVVGEVTRAGTYDVGNQAGVLHALAAAGGLTQWADRSGIYVLRYGYWADGNPEPARIRFRYSALTGGTGPAATFRLKDGDVVVVE